MPLSAVMIQEEPTERRREERWRLRVGARWLDAQPHAQSIIIVDVSPSGFLIEMDHELPVGACLIVEMPGGRPKFCKTVWTSGSYHGAEFSEPLSATELASLVHPPHSFDPDRPYEANEDIAFAHEEFGGLNDDAEERLPLATRATIILGTSAFLWVTIGTLLWFSVR